MFTCDQNHCTNFHEAYLLDHEYRVTYTNLLRLQFLNFSVPQKQNGKCKIWVIRRTNLIRNDLENDQ